MSRDIILKSQNLVKYFLEPVRFRVLDKVSFEVRRGEFLTIIGKSGSGKSTLLYCLSTMDTDYEGQLFIDNQLVTGQKIDQLADIRKKKIGFVFQFHYLLPEFSCLKNVMIPALKLGKYNYDEVEERAYQKLEILDLKDQALKDASKLSGGQQQRVALARALINEPDIIMCDEPTGNLDSKNSDIILALFQQLSQDFSQTFIVVTHDLDFAKASDRTIEMRDGMILN